MKKKLLPLLLLLSFLTPNQQLVAMDNRPSDGKTKIVLGTIIAVPSACLAVGSFFYKRKLNKDISELKSKIKKIADKSEKAKLVKKLKSKLNIQKLATGGIWGGAALTVLGALVLLTGLAEKSEYDEFVEMEKEIEREQLKRKKEKEKNKNKGKGENSEKAEALIDKAEEAGKKLSNIESKLNKKMGELKPGFLENNIDSRMYSKLRNTISSVDYTLSSKYQEIARSYLETKNLNALEKEVDKYIKECEPLIKKFGVVEEYIEKLRIEAETEFKKEEKKREKERLLKREKEELDEKIKNGNKEIVQKFINNIRELNPLKRTCEYKVHDLESKRKNLAISRQWNIKNRSGMINGGADKNLINNIAENLEKENLKKEEEIKKSEAKLKIELEEFKAKNETYQEACKKWRKTIFPQYNNLFDQRALPPGHLWCCSLDGCFSDYWNPEYDNSLDHSKNIAKLEEKKQLLNDLESFLKSEAYKKL